MVDRGLIKHSVFFFVSCPANRKSKRLGEKVPLGYIPKKETRSQAIIILSSPNSHEMAVLLFLQGNINLALI